MVRSMLPGETVTLIGIGAVGRQVALLLAAQGVRKLQLIDNGVVRRKHIATQGFLADDVGRSKVHATADICQQIDPQLDVIEEDVCFRSTMKIGRFVFCCIASDSSRTRIRNAMTDQCQFWAEASVRADLIRVSATTGSRLPRKSPEGIAVSKSVASRRKTATLADTTLASALLVRQFLKSVSGQCLDDEIVFDLSRDNCIRRMIEK